MEFLVHMAVGRIDAGDEKEKQLRQEEAERGRELARQGNWCAFGAYPADGRTGGYGVRTIATSSTMRWFHCRCSRICRLPYIPWHPIPTIQWHTAV